MPRYDYFCKANGKTVEVVHSMSEDLKTWGEVCERAGLAPGKTPGKTAVIRLIVDVLPMTFRVKGIDKDKPAKKLEL